ncbi:hypothetical protein O9993_11095 [Vibrio lentus]|nr:hypothetical protein [Vibrio lentus]
MRTPLTVARGANGLLLRNETTEFQSRQLNIDDAIVFKCQKWSMPAWCSFVTKETVTMHRCACSPSKIRDYRFEKLVAGKKEEVETSLTDSIRTNHPGHRTIMNVDSAAC